MSLNKGFFRVIVAFSFIATLQAQAAITPATSDIGAILSRMASSSSILYSGTLTYESQGAISSLQVSRSYTDGQLFEQVERLDGPDRSNTFAGEKSSCISTGNFLIRGGAFKKDSGANIHLSKNYDFSLRGLDRIANREVVVLQITPRDEFRYGLTLGIDRESGILLKSLVTAPGKNVLERFQFVTLKMGAQGIQDDSSLGMKPLCISQDGSSAAAEKSPWGPAWLPDGFVLAASSLSVEDGFMQTYTDGLASFSVFLKSPPGVADNKGEVRVGQGVAQLGSSLAVMTVKILGGQAVHVTVVGEVPPQTAREVIRSVSIKPVPESP